MKLVHDGKAVIASSVLLHLMTAREGNFPIVIEAGKDCWKIETLDDAKKMAAGMMMALVMKEREDGL